MFQLHIGELSEFRVKGWLYLKILRKDQKRRDGKTQYELWETETFRCMIAWEENFWL